MECSNVLKKKLATVYKNGRRKFNPLGMKQEGMLHVPKQLSDWPNECHIFPPFNGREKLAAGH